MVVVGAFRAGGHLTKHKPSRPVGRKQQPYIMSDTIYQPERSGMRRQLGDSPPTLQGRVVDGASDELDTAKRRVSGSDLNIIVVLLDVSKWGP